MADDLRIGEHFVDVLQFRARHIDTIEQVQHLRDRAAGVDAPID